MNKQLAAIAPPRRRLPVIHLETMDAAPCAALQRLKTPAVEFATLAIVTLSAIAATLAVWCA